jgi:hypothetical protein
MEQHSKVNHVLDMVIIVLEKKENKDGTIFWECTSKSCIAHVRTVGERIESHNNHHSHG